MPEFLRTPMMKNWRDRPQRNYFKKSNPPMGQRNKESKIEDALVSNKYTDNEQYYNRELDSLMRENTSDSLLKAWRLVHYMFDAGWRVLCYVITLLFKKTQKLQWADLLFDGLSLVEKHFLNGAQRKDVDEALLNSILDAYSRLDKDNRDVVVVGDQGTAIRFGAKTAKITLTADHKTVLVCSQSANAEDGHLKALLAGASNRSPDHLDNAKSTNGNVEYEGERGEKSDRDKSNVSSFFALDSKHDNVYAFQIIDHIVELFDRMNNGEWPNVRPDTPTYGILMRAFGIAGKPEQAFAFWGRMCSAGLKASVITIGSLMDAATKSGQHMHLAVDLWERVLMKNQRNCILYTTIIKGFCNMGDLKRAEDFYDEMRADHIEKNITTFNTIISAACGISNSRGANINMALAEKCFQELCNSDHTMPDQNTYLAMLKGYLSLNESEIDELQMDRIQDIFQSAMDKCTGLRFDVHSMIFFAKISILHGSMEFLVQVLEKWHVFTQSLPTQTENSTFLKKLCELCWKAVVSKALCDACPRDLLRQYRTTIRDHLRVLDEKILSGLQASVQRASEHCSEKIGERRRKSSEQAFSVSEFDALLASAKAAVEKQESEWQVNKKKKLKAPLVFGGAIGRAICHRAADFQRANHSVNEDFQRSGFNARITRSGSAGIGKPMQKPTLQLDGRLVDAKGHPGKGKDGRNPHDRTGMLELGGRNMQMHLGNTRHANINTAHGRHNVNPAGVNNITHMSTHEIISGNSPRLDGSFNVPYGFRSNSDRPRFDPRFDHEFDILAEGSLRIKSTSERLDIGRTDGGGLDMARIDIGHCSLGSILSKKNQENLQRRHVKKAPVGPAGDVREVLSGDVRSRDVREEMSRDVREVSDRRMSYASTIYTRRTSYASTNCTSSEEPSYHSEAMHHESRHPGRPYEDRHSGRPYEDSHPGRPYEDCQSGRPYEGSHPGRPYEGSHPGRPYEDSHPGRPYAGSHPGRPYEGSQTGRPYEDSHPGRPYEGPHPGRQYEDSHPGRPYEGSHPGMSYDGLRSHDHFPQLMHENSRTDVHPRSRMDVPLIGASPLPPSTPPTMDGLPSLSPSMDGPPSLPPSMDDPPSLLPSMDGPPSLPPSMERRSKDSSMQNAPLCLGHDDIYLASEAHHHSFRTPEEIHAPIDYQSRLKDRFGEQMCREEMVEHSTNHAFLSTPHAFHPSDFMRARPRYVHHVLHPPELNPIPSFDQTATVVPGTLPPYPPLLPPYHERKDDEGVVYSDRGHPRNCHMQRHPIEAHRHAYEGPTQRNPYETQACFYDGQVQRQPSDGHMQRHPYDGHIVSHCGHPYDSVSRDRRPGDSHTEGAGNQVVGNNVSVNLSAGNKVAGKNHNSLGNNFGNNLITTLPDSMAATVLSDIDAVSTVVQAMAASPGGGGSDIFNGLMRPAHPNETAEDYFHKLGRNFRNPVADNFQEVSVAENLRISRSPAADNLRNPTTDDILDEHERNVLRELFGSPKPEAQNPREEHSAAITEQEVSCTHCHLTLPQEGNLVSQMSPEIAPIALDGGKDSAAKVMTPDSSKSNGSGLTTVSSKQNLMTDGFPQTVSTADGSRFGHLELDLNGLVHDEEAVQERDRRMSITPSNVRMARQNDFVVADLLPGNCYQNESAKKLECVGNLTASAQKRVGFPPSPLSNTTDDAHKINTAESEYYDAQSTLIGSTMNSSADSGSADDGRVNAVENTVCFLHCGEHFVVSSKGNHTHKEAKKVFPDKSRVAAQHRPNTTAAETPQHHPNIIPDAVAVVDDACGIHGGIHTFKPPPRKISYKDMLMCPK